ncbi:MAG TPA: glycosyl hydrolase family 28 protein [Verrucomicrobiae bacterium]
MPKFKASTFKWLVVLSVCLMVLSVQSVKAKAMDPAAIEAQRVAANRASITDFGAVGDGQTLNTVKIQSVIDQLAAEGGGTLVIPKGVFLSGALFLKPDVDLYLEQGAVLRGSTNVMDYPKTKTRIEGHFEEWLPALINADHCDHLRITGSGTLDGNGLGFYTKFWAARRKDPQVTNLAVERPRLMLIEDSRDVQIDGITFTNSGFWNLHLYRCQDVLVENSRFEVPGNLKCPSTDGTDIDSCQYITIRGCTYNVDDDCIGLKGSKGPFAMTDKESPPVAHIRVSDCTFERGNGVLTLGSEATLVHDVLVQNCRVVGKVNLAVLKLRPDTPQHYEDIHYRNITLNSQGSVINVQPWTQFFDLKGQKPPKSLVNNVTLSDIKGSCRSFGVVRGATNQTSICDITLKNINVQAEKPQLIAVNVKDLRTGNVMVNGKPLSVGNSGEDAMDKPKD